MYSATTQPEAIAGGAVLQRLGRFVSRRTGVLREPVPVMLPAQLPDLFVYQSSNLGSGAALTAEEALICTIGESIERYCGLNYEPETAIVAPYRALPAEAAHPSRYALFSESQYETPKFPYAAFTEDANIRWTAGWSLHRKTEVLVPTCLASMAYRRRVGERWLAPASSNGLACHGSAEAATLKGIYEVIERDVFFTMWLNRLRRPRVTIDDAGALQEVFARQLNKPGIEYQFIDLTMDIDVPVIACLARMPYGDKMLTGVGSAANLDPAEALLKAAVEAAHTLIWAECLINRTDWVFDPSFANILDFPDHVRLYCEPRMQSELAFMTASKEVRRLSEVPNRATGSIAGDLAQSLAALDRQRLEAIAVDLTPDEVADLGLSVIKVMVPEAVTVNGDHAYRFLGGERLYETPVRLGYRASRIEEAALNPAPHPFP